MFVHLRFLIVFLLLIIHLSVTRAQSVPHSYARDTSNHVYIIVDEIQITGNKKTDVGIILRELTFKQGDTVQTDELDKILTQSTENILKTSLFHKAVITITETEAKKIFQVNVTERWYWWIWPLLENPDRNFNDWWQHKDVMRLSAGVHFQHENMRGRMEKLNLKVLGGYRTYLAANYEWPYINRKKTLGLGILASYYTKYEVNYATFNNRQLFYHGNNIMLKSANYGIYTRFRPGNHVSHFLTLQYADVLVNDTIRLLNPEFQLYSNKFNFLSINYSIKVDYRDNRNYPLKGWYTEAETGIVKNLSTDYNQRSIRFSARGYKSPAARIYAASEIAARFTGPEVKPYPLQNSLGYDRDFVRGYEFMVIEAPHYWLFKSQLRYKAVSDLKIRLPIIKSEKFNPVPLSVYAGAHYDMGQAFPALNPEINSMQGQLLTGYGIGIDFVTFYDKVVRIEYTFRHTEQGGLFIHFMAMI